MHKFIPRGYGWIPDLPDPRDYSYLSEGVHSLLRSLQPLGPLPDQVNLGVGDEGEVFFTDVEDQGELNSSTAFAVLSIVEYFERRSLGKTFDASKLFLYKTTRNLRKKQAQVSGDTGADLRTTLKALCKFGVLPEEHWPYESPTYDREPSSFTYQIANEISGLRYFRIEHEQSDLSQWELITSFLSAGFPIAFGFSVLSSITSEPEIPFRPTLDDVRGGQASVAIGYRQHHFGKDQHALLVRSSWGKQWGDDGNGWMPATYVTSGIARDFWTLFKESWVDANEFKNPTGSPK